MGSTTWQQSAVWGKCKNCFRLVGLVPRMKMCYPCFDVKVGKVKEVEARRTGKRIEPLRNIQEMDWNWKRPW